jgi:hypothetical protein
MTVTARKIQPVVARVPLRGQPSDFAAGVRVPFIDVASLRKNKQAVGRHQDLADLENLE